MNKKLKIALASSVAAVSVASAAYAETVYLNSNLSVAGDVTITEVQPMSFGSIFAVGSNYTGQATLIQDTEGKSNSPVTLGPPGAEHTITQVVAGQPGIFEVDLGVPNVIVNVASENLSDLVNGPDTLYLTNIVFAPTQSATDGVFDTDASGVLRFASGASLSTNTGTKTIGDAALAAQMYPGGVYTGSFDVKVTF